MQANRQRVTGCEPPRILHHRAVLQLHDAVAPRQYAFGAQVEQAAGESCQPQLVLFERTVRGVVYSRAQRREAELFALDDMSGRHQALAQVCKVKTGARHLACACMVKTMLQSIQIKRTPTQLLGRVHQSACQIVESLGVVLQLARQVVCKLTREPVELLLQFCA